MVIDPNFVLVNVQVTLAPATRLIVATRVVVSPLPPVLQARPVSFQLLTRLSVIEYGPGVKPLNVFVFDSVASASSSKLKGVSPVPRGREGEVHAGVGHGVLHDRDRTRPGCS